MSDPLSDLLGAVRLTGGVFLDARFTAPWCLLSGISPEFCQVLNWSPAQVISYHFVIAGRMKCSVVGGGPSLDVEAGQIVLLPRNDNHTLASAGGLKPVDAGSLVANSMVNGFARIAHGGGGPETRIVCGYMGTEGGFNPLIETLPPLLKVNIAEGASRDWVESSVRFAVNELAQGRLASSAVLVRLSEILFVEAVRQHAENADSADLAWLKGMRDPQIGRALALIHRDIGRSCPLRRRSHGGPVAQCLHGEICEPHRCAARALRHPLAPQDCPDAASRNLAQHCPDRPWCRL